MKNHPNSACFASQTARRYNTSPLPSTPNNDHWQATSHLAGLYPVRPSCRNLCIGFALLILIGFFPSTAKANGNIPPDSQAVIDSINQIRASHGLNHVALNPHLTQAAQTHVIDMVTNRNHSHTGTDGSTARIRIERTGYGSGYWSGENWVALTDPARAVQWWMNSPPHRANILNQTWQEVGIGSGVNSDIGLNYFVVVFAARADGSVAPIAEPSNAPQAPSATTVPAVIPDFHQVQTGETLSSIATKYGLTWQSIATTNNLGEFSILSVGQAIRLPSGLSVGGPQTEGSVQDVAYTVVTGDTLIAIAGRFDIPWQDIAFRNGLGEQSVLNIDQVLQIPVTIDASTVEALAQVEAAAANIPATHTVQTGETVITIALQHQLNWKELLRLNGLGDSTLLAVGQTIRLK